MCLDENEDPACVYACPHDAAHRVDGQKFFDQYLLGARAVSEKTGDETDTGGRSIRAVSETKS
jgi:hypothetical protein